MAAVSEPTSEDPGRPPDATRSAADRVGSILTAAEETAQRIRAETEVRAGERIAEAERAAEYRVAAAEEEAAELLQSARADAERMLREGREEAARYTRELIGEARTTAQEVRRDGMEVVANMRQMGDSLRVNAERILRDVQVVHSQLVAKIDRLERSIPAANRAPARRRADRAGDLTRGPLAGEAPDDMPDVPEFIPRR